MLQVTTVGFGDVTPETWVELLLMGIIMLTQIVIFGFLIGTMTEIVTNSMTNLRQAEKYKGKMESVENWLMHYDIPSHLVRRVKVSSIVSLPLRFLVVLFPSLAA